MEDRWEEIEEMGSTAGKKRSTFFWFMGQLQDRLWIYLAAITLSVAGLAGAQIANSYMVKQVVTAAQTGETQGVAGAVLLTFIVYIMSRILWRFGIVHYNTEGWRGIAHVEKQVFAKALRLPYAYYEEHHSGEFMSKLIFDTEKAGDIFSSRLRRLAEGILSSVFYLIPMLCYNWRLTLCLLALSIFLLGGNSLLTKPMKSLGREASKRNADLTEKFTNLLSGMEIVKMLPAQEELLGDYEKANFSCYQTQQRTNRLSAVLIGMNQFFDLLGTFAFLGLGLWFVSRRMATLGELTAVYTLYGAFRGVFLEIGIYFPQMMNCIANAEKLREFLGQEEADLSQGFSPEETDVRSPAGLRAEAGNCYGGSDGGKSAGSAIVVEHVSFAYDNSSVSFMNDNECALSNNMRRANEILSDVSLNIKKGETVAIVGESGCGKSTLAKLLLGFYQPTEGSIYIDGTIAYVPQEPYLYQMSIADNIACGKGAAAASREEIVRAAKIANAHEFISRLPQGYETMVGERGNTLSGGERQRIAIARAVLKGADILLLDEATSSLDNESERLVNEAIRRIGKSCTIIMIAHRESTIAMADRVQVL